MSDWEDLDEDNLPPVAPLPPPDLFKAAELRARNPPTVTTSKADTEPQAVKAVDDRPLILVNLTVLTNGKLHNRFDKASCNDPDLKREWTRRIEDSYRTYANDAQLLAEGTVKACGSAVWRDALVTLREEAPGQFWCPCFPPPLAE